MNLNREEIEKAIDGYIAKAERIGFKINIEKDKILENRQHKFWYFTDVGENLATIENDFFIIEIKASGLINGTIYSDGKLVQPFQFHSGSKNGILETYFANDSDLTGALMYRSQIYKDIDGNPRIVKNDKGFTFLIESDDANFRFRAYDKRESKYLFHNDMLPVTGVVDVLETLGKISFYLDAIENFTANFEAAGNDSQYLTEEEYQKRKENLTPDQKEILDAVMETRQWNLASQMEKLKLLKGVRDEHSLGQYFVFTICKIGPDNEILRHIDYDKIGKIENQRRHGFYVSTGYLDCIELNKADDINKAVETPEIKKTVIPEGYGKKKKGLFHR